MVTTSPEEAYRKYEELTDKHITTLRRLTKSINDSKIARATEDIKAGLAAFDQAVEAYMP
jgi:tetratricopeptide repeat protein 30